MSGRARGDLRGGFQAGVSRGPGRGAVGAAGRTGDGALVPGRVPASKDELR